MTSGWTCVGLSGMCSGGMWMGLRAGPEDRVPLHARDEAVRARLLLSLYVR